MLNEKTMAAYTAILQEELLLATGCTEPIAVAYCAAKLREVLGGKPEEVLAEVSGNILKNGMGVGIPGTGMIGLRIAAALGAVCGNAGYGLEVLKDIDNEGVALAKKMVVEGRVGLELKNGAPKLYVKAKVGGAGHEAWAVIENMHDRIVETGLDGIAEDLRHHHGDVPGENGEDERETLDYHLTVKEICEFAETADIEDIRFILDDRKLNLALAEEGLKGEYGLKVGKAILSNSEEVFGNDFLTYAMALTAAASDARMAGCTLPAMSNSGSGNQGITVSMPVIAYAERHGTDDETLARALILSNLIAIHIKGYLGRLSALCGCVVASTGAACGLVWLKGGKYAQICSAIKNMIGNITGMICDGAKPSCALKVSSGVSTAMLSALMAMENKVVTSVEGIIDEDVDRSIANLTSIGSKGMEATDRLVLDIMTAKA